MKKLTLLFVSLILLVSTSACNSDKASILFNKNKITAENAMDYSDTFSVNERIYYLVLLPKEVESRIINIQLIKCDNKYNTLGYKLYWSYTARLMDNQMYYYDDYVVVAESGFYIMKIYSKDNPKKLVCQSQFIVK